jgi:AcrR family transcriptional regulator
VAREKDGVKRLAIMAAAKKLFAEEGFHGASMSDLARATQLPVGSLYTYFDSKEALIRSIIEEGWGEFFSNLGDTLTTVRKPEVKLAIIVYRVLPSLFEDVELITILLSEGARYAGLEEKLEALTALIADLVLELARERGLSMAFPRGQAKAALALYFLGSLDTVRLSKMAGLEIPASDIIDFIRLSIENSFRVDLDPSLAGLQGHPAP